MRNLVPAIAAMAVVVVASNVLVQFLLGDWLTWGAITYPFAFLVTDITNRVHGPRAAHRVVVAGFAVGLACSLVAAGLDRTTLRIAIGSGAAFLVAQSLDVAVFNKLRLKSWWQAPLVSSLCGSVIDTALFFTIAFAAFLPVDGNTGWANDAVPLLGAGPVVPLWVSLGMADWMVKLALAALALVPFRLMVRKILAGSVEN